MYLSSVISRGGERAREKEFTSWLRVRSLFSTWVNDIKFCPTFYRQDLLSFDSLSRDWILKLDPNDNFRNYILNLDIHNFSLDYPWVMTPLSNTMGNFSVYDLTVVR